MALRRPGRTMIGSKRSISLSGAGPPAGWPPGISPLGEGAAIVPLRWRHDELRPVEEHHRQKQRESGAKACEEDQGDDTPRMRSRADNSVGKVIDNLLRNDLILVDEVGFAPLD